MSISLSTIVSNGSGVTSVSLSAPTGLEVSGSPVTSVGTLTITYAAGYSIPTNAAQANWNTAYADRNKWDGGATGLVASTGRTSLGATTVGANLFQLANPSAVRFIQVNADNSVSAIDAGTFRTNIAAVASNARLASGTLDTILDSQIIGLSGTASHTNYPTNGSSYDPMLVMRNSTDVAVQVIFPRTGAGMPAFRGYSTSSWGSWVNLLCEGRAGSGASLTSLNAANISSGTLAVARGGTGVTTSTGTGSVVLSTSPTLTTPILGTPTSGNLANCTFPTLNQNTTGSAATLTTARLINGVSFNGSANITVTAAAGTLTGSTLASGVTASSLTSVGILTGLAISNTTSQLSITSTATTGTILGNKGNRLFLVSNSTTAGNGGELVFATADTDVGRWAAISGHIVSNNSGAASGDIVFATKATTAATALVERLRISGTGATTVTGTLTATNLSGTNTGDQTTITGNAGSATILQTARTIGISGAVTGTATSFNGSANITIPITALDVGSATAGTLAVARGGTGVTTSTGTGAVVLSASPALTGTPTAPTPAANDNSTKLATTAYVDAAVPSSSSANTPNTLVLRDASGDFSAGIISGTSIQDSYGAIRDIPQVLNNAHLSFVLNMAGRHVIKTNTGAYTWTISPDSTTNFPIGSALTIVNDGGSGNVSISPGSGVTLLNGATSGTYALLPNSARTLLKVGVNRWRVL